VKTILVIALALYCKIGMAQSVTSTLDVQMIKTLEVRSLVGFWELDDSAKSRIEFIDTSWYELILDLKDGMHPYYFPKDKQKQNLVSSSGYFPNWPPYDCDLILQEPELLEIRRSQVGGQPHIVRCKRIR